MTLCRTCHEPYVPWPRSSADDRCGACKAAHRYWRPEQIGTRAQVSVRCHWSSLDGCAGVGRRVSTPHDGWMVRLHDGDGRELYFGGGEIEVDWALGRVPEAERSIFSLAGRGNGHTLTETSLPAPDKGPAVVCDVPGRQASQGARNAK